MSSKDIQFPLAELATTMMREVFQSIQDSATEQLDGYASLVAKASLPEAAYLDETLGKTPEARKKLAEKYLREVVLPVLEIPAETIPDPLLLSAEARDRLIAIFADLAIAVTSGGVTEEHTIDELITASGGGSFPWAITQARLYAAAGTRLEKDARHGLAKIRTMLKSGLPQVSVTGGQVCAKVTLTTTETAVTTVKPAVTPAAKALNTVNTVNAPSLGLAVRVANERSAAFTRSQELIGSVRIDFRVGTFPQVDTEKG